MVMVPVLLVVVAASSAVMRSSRYK